MAEPLSLDTTPPTIEPPKLSLDTGTVTSVPPAPEIAAQKAFKANYGLGPLIGTSYDDYYNMITGGKEGEARRASAAKLDAQREQYKQTIVNEFARQKEGRFTQPDVDALKKRLSDLDEPTNPNSVFEYHYGKQYMNYLDKVGLNQDSYWNDAMNVDPDRVKGYKELGADWITKTDMIKNKMMDVQQQVEAQSYTGYGIDWLKLQFPFYQQVKERGVANGFFEGGVTLGGNLDRQRIVYLNMPLPEFAQRFPADIDRLAKDNPQLALQFMASMLGQSVSERFMNDFIGASDIFPIAGGAAKLALRGAKTAVKDAARSSVLHPSTKENIAKAAGDIPEAAVQFNMHSLITDFKGTANPVKDSLEAVPTALKQGLSDFEKDTGNLSLNLVNRMRERWNSAIINLPDLLANIVKVDQAPVISASETLSRVIQAKLKEEATEVWGDHVADVTGPHMSSSTGLYSHDIKLTKKDGDLWGKPIHAYAWAEDNGILDPVIGQQGNKYYVSVSKPTDLTKPWMRDLLLQTKTAEKPHSLLSSFLGRFNVLTPEETLSADNSANRKAVALGHNKILELISDEAKEIQKLESWSFPGTSKGQKWRDWKRIVELGQRLPDKEDGIPGYTFKNYVELENAYRTHIKRPPDPQEVAAYFAYSRINAIDHGLRDFMEHQSKWVLGGEQHRAVMFDKAGNRIESPFFDGVSQNKMPKGRATALIVDSKDNRLVDISNMKRKAKERLRDAIKAGEYRVVKLLHPERHPLTGFGEVKDEHMVQYAIVKNHEFKPLEYGQLPQRGGGHHELDYAHYIKQARIERDPITGIVRYMGDRTIAPTKIAALGRKAAETLDKVRELIKDKNWTEAKRVADKLPYEWKEITSWFHPHRGPDGKLHPPHLNPDEKIQLVPRDRMIIDVDKSIKERVQGGKGFVDGTTEGPLKRQAVQFTGERDAFEVRELRDVGTRHNPLYEAPVAEYIDPIVMMNRALSRIAKSTFMDPYKHFAVEHWIQEALPLLADKNRDIRKAPFAYFNEPRWLPGLKGEDLLKAKRLEAEAAQIKQFLGVPSELDSTLTALTQSLLSSVYTRMGPRAARILDPTWALPFLKDPARFIRAMVFHTSMGLFSVPQILVQSMTFVNIWGIAGAQHAGPGTMGALFHQWARINPSMIDTLDRYASKMGYRPGEWKEANFILNNRTGLPIVSGEYSLRDDLMAGKIIQSGWKRFLDAGTIFFKGSERNSRFGAWYTAYHEFREKNPTGALNNRDILELQNRADLLNNNMTNASNSRLQHGVLSVPFQFYGYSLRLAELMLGGRLGWKEKARLLAYNAAMFGVPAGVGVFGFPAGDFIRKYANENGYVAGDNFIQSLAMEGIPAMMVALISGHGNMSDGEWTNLGDRMGTAGFTTTEDILRGDKPWWTLIGGAAFSTMAGAFEQSSNFTAAMMSAIRDDGQSFPTTIDDIMDVAKIFTSANYGIRSYVAYTTGLWMSKKGTILKDNMSPTTSILLGLTGLQPRSAADLHLLSWSIKDRETVWKTALNQFVEQQQRGYRAWENPEQAKKYFIRAWSILRAVDYPVDKYDEAISLANQGQEDLISKLNWKYFVKEVPAGQELKSIEKYQNIMKAQGQK